MEVARYWMERMEYWVYSLVGIFDEIANESGGSESIREREHPISRNI